MTSFLKSLARFLTAFFRSMEDHDFRALFILVVFLLLSGSIFYRIVEGWGFVDSIYFSVMTLSTVGYGDLHPTTQLSKIFTMVYLVMGTSVFVGFIAKITNQQKEFLVSRHERKTEK